MIDFKSPARVEAWARGQVAHLPQRWQARAMAMHSRLIAASGAERDANIALRELLDRLARAPLPHDASDSELIDKAEACAAECAELMEVTGDRYEAGSRYCDRYGIRPPTVKEGAPIAPALARLRCPMWWRRKLRAAQAASVEASAIRLGFVGFKGDKYVSDETQRRHAQQQRRNSRTLENTLAENEEGQRFTLAELAARSVANPEIRRGELITRLKGFEAIAADCDHRAVFFTITAPSRYHPTSGGEPNTKHDGSTPAEAQKYLARVWARIRAALARDALPVYGFRIAEPHADGCPHWHMILFAPTAGHVAALWAIVRRYALADSGEEAGASRHRVKAELIDRARGSAVGYVIKYISKAIDGFRVGDWKIDGDLAGDEELCLSPRVVAWASTWRIRQFQQIGGPPVGLWREMRRVPSEKLVDAPDVARDAWMAAQRMEDKPAGAEEPVRVAQADFAEFTRAAGGPVCARADRPLMLATRPSEQSTRYGDAPTPRPFGIFALAPRVREFGGMVGELVVGATSRLIESMRRVWRIVRGGYDGSTAGLREQPLSADFAVQRVSTDRMALQGEGVERLDFRTSGSGARPNGGRGISGGFRGSEVAARSAAPRTRVNNCTHRDDSGYGQWRPGDHVSPADVFRSWAWG
jgi:hypothetical protein